MPVEIAGGSEYLVQPGRFVLFNPTKGPGPITLPASPPDRTQIGVQIRADGLTTVRTSGNDIFAGGGTTWPNFQYASQTAVWQYAEANDAWIPVSNSLAVSALSALYASSSAPTINGTLTADGLGIKGIPGLTYTSRYMGLSQVSGGPPVDPQDGTFQRFDQVSDTDGHLYTLLSPGVWSGPSQALVPSATTLDTSAITASAATVSGAINPNASGTVTYQFEYGTTTGYGSVSPGSPGATVAGITDQTFTASLSGLSANTTYHYRINAILSGTPQHGADLTFTTLAAAPTPTVTVDPVSGIGQTTATVSGSINPNLSNVTVYQVRYGLTTGYGSTASLAPTPGSGSVAVPVSVGLTGLTAGTTYHFSIRATNGNGTTDSADGTFATLAATPLPTVTTNAASGLTTTSATLNASANPNGLATTVRFDYGLTGSYGSSTPPVPISIGSGSTTSGIGTLLSNLSPGTTYHFRATATNAGGTANGGDLTFTTTAAATPPSNVAAPVASGGTSVGAVLSSTTGTWSGTAPITYAYQWYRSGTPIGGATSSTYTLVIADQGFNLTCGVTASNASGQATANSNAVAIPTGVGGALFEVDPTSGTLPTFQGCHTANDGYNSLTPVTATFVPASSTSGIAVGRPCYEFHGVEIAGGPQAQTFTCKGARTDACAISALTQNNVLWPPDATRIANGTDSFYISWSLRFPAGAFPVLNFSTQGVGYFSLNEIFGWPFNSGPGWSMLLDSSNHLLVRQGDYTTGHFNAYTVKDLGTLQYDIWYDFMFHFRPNTFTTPGGVYTSNRDGWIEMWYSTNNNAIWTLGTQQTLSSADPAYNNGAGQTNVSRLNLDLWLPGYSWPATTANDPNRNPLWYNQGYTFKAPGPAPTKPNLPDWRFLHGRVKAGYSPADVAGA